MSDGNRINFKKLLWIKLLILSSIVALTVLFSSLYLLSGFSIPSAEDSYTFEIKPGDSLYKVSHGLLSDNILTYPRLFRLFTFVLGVDNNIQTGEYEIFKNTRVYDLIQKISTGDVKQYKLTIVEGDNFNNLVKNIKSLSNIQIVSGNSPEQYKTKLKESIESKKIISFVIQYKDWKKLINLDGLLYPDTYFYIKNDADLDIITRAFSRLDAKVEQLWQKRDKKIDKYIQSPYQALILASIIEKECSDSNERFLVSGVLYNRLERNMYLQVDPTVIYALGEDFKGNLSKQDLSVDSPYNTYKNKGLPPTPIGFVSTDSIEAALNPRQHDLLYFVAMGNGKHFFSADLETHNEAVFKYQKQRAEKKSTENSDINKQ